jgi:hypothetical protein
VEGQPQVKPGHAEWFYGQIFATSVKIEDVQNAMSNNKYQDQK